MEILAHTFSIWGPALILFLERQKKLDLKIADTRFYLNGHPKCTPSDKKALEFFLLVEACREKQNYYFRYKRQKDFDQEVANKIKQECKDYEKQIDEYCRKKIGL
jgi:hypothetical protein